MVVFDGGTGGHVLLTIDFGVLLTGIESVIIHGWDAFNPPHWNKLCPSVSCQAVSTDNNRAALLAILSVCTKPRPSTKHVQLLTYYSLNNEA